MTMVVMQREVGRGEEGGEYLSTYVVYVVLFVRYLCKL